jgi:hypothetical protein
VSDQSELPAPTGVKARGVDKCDQVVRPLGELHGTSVKPAQDATAGGEIATRVAMPANPVSLALDIYVRLGKYQSR